IEQASGDEKAAKEAELESAEAEKKSLRHEELASIDWRTLWGIPAAFAALIMVAFAVLFKNEPAESVASEDDSV
ncbi:MAG: hypothetical protein VYC71_08885, partial [Planctomycetota bacterium]|nr:hypothetical protein [Planctomycetota bacterium]